MPKLTEAEQSTFLDEREHILRVATVDTDGMPRLVPVWFLWSPTATGSEIVFTPRAASIFLANLRRDPRLALSIDEASLPYRKISVQGRAEIRHDVGDDDRWRDVYRSIAERYLDPEGAARYLRATHDQPRALVAVPLGPARVTSWRMPTGNEDGTGIWARRYYEPGSDMSERAGSGRPGE